MIESNLIKQLESEISGLLGSIKVQASSIKQTLQKQKSILTETDDDKNKQLDNAIELDEVKIEFEVGETDLSPRADSKLDMSMNSVITVLNENDAQSNLDTSVVSVVSVIKVSDEE